jgi:hypothetical protein
MRLSELIGRTTLTVSSRATQYAPGIEPESVVTRDLPDSWSLVEDRTEGDPAFMVSPVI